MAQKIPANKCMGNHYTTKSIFNWFKCTNYSLYDIKNYFQIKCPKGTGSAWEIVTPVKVVFLAVNIFAVQMFLYQMLVCPFFSPIFSSINYMHKYM